MGTDWLRDRWNRPWLSESRRSGAAFVVGIPVVVVRAVLAGDDAPAGRTIDTGLLFMVVYLLAYCVATVWGFTRADDQQVRRWAHREGRGSWLQRYVWGTAPGPGVSISLALVALVVAVFWLPRSDTTGSQLPGLVRPGVGVGIVALSWLAVALSYAVAYWADNLLEDEQGLDFPDTPAPVWSDYFYFAVAVSTTFGTTDVTVKSGEMRRTVTVHAILAFVFNTVILAAAVGSLATLS